MDPQNNEHKESKMAIRNINPELGDRVTFESVEEMEQAIRELESLNGGEWMPEDGLREGRDYEVIPSTIYEVWENGHRVETFATLAQAEAYMESHGFEYIDSRSCDHPSEERMYYLPVGEIEKYPHSDAAFESLYGYGYEPNITPVER